MKMIVRVADRFRTVRFKTENLISEHIIRLLTPFVISIRIRNNLKQIYEANGVWKKNPVERRSAR